MTPERRRAVALRVGGAVISASLLLLVERCVREDPPAVQPPPARPPAPRPPAPLPAALPAKTQAGGAPHPHAGAAAPDHRAGGSADAPRALDRPPRAAGTLQALLAGLPHRDRPGLVAGVELPPAPPSPPRLDPPAAAPVDAAADIAAAPADTSLHAIVGAAAAAPREPLLGLARSETAAPAVAPRPAVSANDNDRPAVVPPTLPETPSPPVEAQAAATPPPSVAPTAAQPAPTAVSPPPDLSHRVAAPGQAAAATAGTAPFATVAPAAPQPEQDTSPGAITSPAMPPLQLDSASPPPSPAASTPAAAPAATPPPPIAAVAADPRSPAPPFGGPAITGFSDDDELILEITTAHRELSGTIVAYSQRGIPFLPLGEIARFLDLAVTVSDSGRYATGWALDPARTVTLNLREGTLTVDGQTRPLAPGDAVAFDGELYLRADRFADLFPLTLATNLRAQTVTVQTRVPFPFEQRLARENAREQLKSRQGRRDGRSFARVATPWRLADVPIIDSELRLASDTTRGTRSEADLHLAGDLAWLTARAFVSSDSQRGLTAARLELGRRDPDGGLLGPLHATAFGIGDVTSLPLAMGPTSVAGRGFSLGNASLERASVFDRIDLRGDMPDGFEAELYRNDVLVDTSSTPENGQYRFLNVPVEFGLNVFRVVLYGPQGQRRETVRQISVGDGRLGRGEFVYSAGAVQKNRSLFNLQGRDFLPGPEDGALRASAQVQYGFTGGLTGMLGGALYDRFGTRGWLATGGLRTGLAGFAVRLDLGLSDQSGRALSLGLARKVGGFSVTLNHAEYAGTFVDEVRAFSEQPLRRASELAFNGSLRLGGGDNPLRIPLNGLARDLTFADGRRVISASLNQTLPLARSLQLSNLVEFNRTSQPLFGATSQLRGAFDLSTLARGKTQVRASLGYAVLPRAEITSAAVQVDRRIGEHTTLSATAGHTFAARQDRIGLSAIHRFSRFSLAVDGAYSTRPGQYAAMLRLGFSLGRNPLDGRLFTAPPGLASGGAVALHAFRDLDGDGRLSPGEPPLADVRFFAGGENRATDAAGNVLLGRLGDGPRTSVRIDADSLPDINLAPATEGVELVPRAGRIHVQPFAVRALGALDGTAYFRTAAGEKGVSGAIVLLVDPQGKTAARTRTGSDGSFWFEKVVPGDYELRLDPGQAERLKIRLAAPQRVTIRADGDGPRVVLHLIGSDPAS